MQRHVRDIQEAEFGSAVVERSRAVPVVVDFWAAWCGPCRALGPTLEREVEALGGRVELVKVDVDASPALSAQFQIQSIPAVKAFRNGQVVDEFLGARDAAFLRKWLAALAPSPSVQVLEKAESDAAAGRLDEAEAAFRALLDDTDAQAASVKPRAALGLADVLLRLKRASEAGPILDAIPPHSPEAAQVAALRHRVAFVVDAESFGGEEKARAALAADEKNLEARYALASALAARGELRPALVELLDIVSRSRKFRDDGAKAAMLALFEQAGADSPLVHEFRRKLQVVL